jgi:hypothetical protein
MKTSKLTLTIVALAALITNSASRAQVSDKSALNFKPRSSGDAQLYSLSGTLLPIAAGIAWWVLDEDEKVIEVMDYGDWSHSRVTHVASDKTIPNSLIFAGLFGGPAIGYYYGGCYKRGNIGILIRAGIFTLFAVEPFLESKIKGEWTEWSASDLFDPRNVGGIYLLVLIESVYDICKVKGAIDKYNHKHSNRTSGLTLTPKYFADTGAAGLQLDVNF